MTFDSFRSFMEIVYFGSGIILVVIGAISLRQLSLLKYDINTRCRRESMDNSIKIVDRYLDKFVPIYDAIMDKREQEKIPTYAGTYDCLPKSNPKIAAERGIKLNLHVIFNELEVISSSVMSGLADDEFVYNSIGISFCGIVASNYDVLSRFTPDGYFPNTAKLFEVWRKRLMKTKLEGKKKACDSILGTICDEKIPSIGQ